jgi:hypothetical protein
MMMLHRPEFLLSTCRDSTYHLDVSAFNSKGFSFHEYLSTSLSSAAHSMPIIQLNDQETRQVTVLSMSGITLSGHAVYNQSHTITDSMTKDFLTNAQVTALFLPNGG